MNHEPKVPADAWEVLSPTLSSQRCQRMQQIAGQRTHHVRLVIQDIHNPHNISACLRSAEAFGISRVDIVNTRAFFKVSTASSGVGSWLELRVHTSIAACIAELKNQGYALMLGMPNLDAKPLQQLEVDRPIAVIFGNEHSGVSPEWFNGIDGTFTVPMVGFVESLNRAS
jgi:tRNA (guanosine-2'-O-)-methyltransferase